MAWPANKSRRLSVDGGEYEWSVSSKRTLSTPRGVEADDDGVLPPLDSSVPWYGYEDIYGYSTLVVLRVRSCRERAMVQFHIDSTPFVAPSLEPNNVRHIPITPAIVIACIRRTNEAHGWIDGATVDDTVAWLSSDIQRALEELDSPAE